MTELLQIYKCNICGNIVEVLHAGNGTLVCCGEPMHLCEENTQDATLEKHVPVIEKTEDGKTLIKVGSEPHPMIPEHYIEFIEIISEDGTEIQRKFLHPDEQPLAEFNFSGDKIKARELCNIHGLWSKKND